MKSATNPQHGVIDHLVAIWMHGHSFRHNLFDLVGHHTKLAAMAPSVTIFGLVVEQVEADAVEMATNSDNIFLDASGRH